ncbi:hypothetical protein PIB30_051624 [Stylosanthes scabra]|uniref:Uncharacterized protein n=1 Tax=Stylosanthes scabra TaxID=79078 RepID=A0ABU6TK89_9FABA|nr:hypothetical protein [Stylosanthes scabra]
MALLFKWWWRYEQEECPLWKKVVKSCNNLQGVSLLNEGVREVRGGGIWTLNWRRPLRGWEEESLKELMVILTRIGVHRCGKDGLNWKHCANGIFSVKSFRHVIYNNKEQGVDTNYVQFYKISMEELGSTKSGATYLVCNP